MTFAADRSAAWFVFALLMACAMLVTYDAHLLLSALA
jgi:hypothetical protein